MQHAEDEYTQGVCAKILTVKTVVKKSTPALPSKPLCTQHPKDHRAATWRPGRLINGIL